MGSSESEAWEKTDGEEFSLVAWVVGAGATSPIDLFVRRRQRWISDAERHAGGNLQSNGDRYDGIEYSKHSANADRAVKARTAIQSQRRITLKIRHDAQCPRCEIAVGIPLTWYHRVNALPGNRLIVLNKLIG